MSVSALSLLPSLTQTPNLLSSLSSLRDEFRQLGQALQNEDLSGADSALTSIQQNASAQNLLSTNSVPSDLGALGAALQSGSLADARNAYAAFTNDISTNQPQLVLSPGATPSASDPATSTAAASSGAPGAHRRGHHLHQLANNLLNLIA